MKQIVLISILLFFTACVTPRPNTHPTSHTDTKILIIDIDQEYDDLKEIGHLRGDESIVIQRDILLEPYQKIQLQGDLLEEKSPFKVKIGDNDEVSFKGNSYTIDTMELKHGDQIIIKDKQNMPFIELNIIK